MEPSQDGLVFREVLGKAALCLHFCYDGNVGGIRKSPVRD